MIRERTENTLLRNKLSDLKLKIQLGDNHYPLENEQEAKIINAIAEIENFLGLENQILINMEE